MVCGWADPRARRRHPFRSYLYAGSSRLALTILLRGQPCRPYNVGSDRDLTIAELARVVAGNSPLKWRYRTGARHCRRVCPHAAGAERELGLRPGFPWKMLLHALRGARTVAATR